MIERRATLLVDKKFEGGLKLKRGTPIFVWETPSGPIGNFYPDALRMGSHSFALDPEDYSLWVRAETNEPYLVVAQEDPPSAAELAKIRRLERDRLEKSIAYFEKRIEEAREELDALE